MTTRNYEGLTPKQILKYFFIDIKAWVENIAVNGVPANERDENDNFVTYAGLCFNLDNWITREQLLGQYIELVNSLEDLFKGYSCMVTPFNGDGDLYELERNKYTNPERLKFINRMVEEL